MHRLDFASPPSKAAADVHEATGVRRDHGVRSALLNECRLVADHRPADFGKPHRERAAEPAALVEPLQGQQLQALYLSEKSFRLALEAQAAQVAGHVVS